MARKRTLTRFVNVRFTEEQLAVLDRKARLAGLSRSALIRRSALGIRIRRAHALRQEATHQLARVGNNLNQLTRVANTTGQIGVARELDEVIDEIRRAIRELIPEGRW